MTLEDLLVLRINQLAKKQEDIDQAAETLSRFRFRSKEKFEEIFQKQLCQDHYQAGELVLIHNMPVEKSLNRKTKPRYIGPYQIVWRTKGGSYVLQELDRMVMQSGVVAFRLMPYITRNEPLLRQLAQDVFSDESLSSSVSSKETSASLNNSSIQNGTGQAAFTYQKQNILLKTLGIQAYIKIHKEEAQWLPQLSFSHSIVYSDMSTIPSRTQHYLPISKGINYAPTIFFKTVNSQDLSSSTVSSSTTLPTNSLLPIGYSLMAQQMIYVPNPTLTCMVLHLFALLSMHIEQRV